MCDLGRRELRFSQVSGDFKVRVSAPAGGRLKPKGGVDTIGIVITSMLVVVILYFCAS